MGLAGVGAPGRAARLTGIALALTGRLEIGLVSAASGIVTGGICALLFQRVDAANRRMNLYHEERHELRWFTILLESCDRLQPPQRRYRCQEQLILSAGQRFLAAPPADKAAAASGPAGAAESER